MRAPPPVEITSVPGRAWRAALSLLVGMAVAVPSAWGLPYIAVLDMGLDPDFLFGSLGDPVLQATLALTAGVLAAAACWLSRRSRSTDARTLRWDGQDWVLAGDARGRPDERGDVALMLDFGPWMLVRFLPSSNASATWLPLTPGGDLDRWAALRGALWNWRAGPRAGAVRP